MTRRRKIDSSKLLEAVESGRLKKEIMDGFGLEKSTPGGGDGATPKRRGRKPKGVVKEPVTLAEVTIGKRGSLVLSKTLIEQLGYNFDDAFLVRKTKAGLILKPL